MRRVNQLRAFALYEVMLGLAIFVIGVLALGRSVENCMNASVLSAQEDRIRQILANRMAEIQATPGQPEAKKELKLATNYGDVKVAQKVVPAGLKDDKDLEIPNIHRVTVSAEWLRRGVKQVREVEFYVYRPG